MAVSIGSTGSYQLPLSDWYFNNNLLSHKINLELSISKCIFSHYQLLFFCWILKRMHSNFESCQLHKIGKARCEELWVRDATLNWLPQTGNTEYPMGHSQQSQRCCHVGLKVSSLGRRDKGHPHEKRPLDIAELPSEGKARCHHPCAGTYMPDLGLNSPWEAKCWKAMWLPHSPLRFKCMNMMESWLTGWEPGVHTWLWWGDNTAFFRMLAAWEPSTFQCTVGPILLAACQPLQCPQQAAPDNSFLLEPPLLLRMKPSHLWLCGPPSPYWLAPSPLSCAPGASARCHSGLQWIRWSAGLQSLPLPWKAVTGVRFEITPHFTWKRQSPGDSFRVRAPGRWFSRDEFLVSSPWFPIKHVCFIPDP